MEDIMENWRLCWRRGVAPLLTRPQLEALRQALASNDTRLVQESSTVPLPIRGRQDWPVEAACPLALCGWLGDGLETVAEVEEYFAQMCFKIDRLLDAPAGCRWFLNFWDDTPRAEAIALLLPEVDLALAAWPEKELAHDPATA